MIKTLKTSGNMSITTKNVQKFEIFFSFLGGELFAKRRKKADKWVVDESSIGSTAPSQFADHFLQQQSFQQQQFQMQQQQEYQVQKGS